MWQLKFNNKINSTARSKVQIVQTEEDFTECHKRTPLILNCAKKSCYFIPNKYVHSKKKEKKKGERFGLN